MSLVASIDVFVLQTCHSYCIRDRRLLQQHQVGRRPIVGLGSYHLLPMMYSSVLLAPCSSRA